MATILYGLFGGIFATALVGWLVGLAFKSKAPTDRAVYAAMISFAICSLAAMAAVYATTGSFSPDVSIYFLPGAIFTAYYLRHSYAKTWSGGAEAR